MDDVVDFEILFDMEVLEPKELLTMQNLHDAWLSPIDSLGKDPASFLFLLLGLAFLLTYMFCSHAYNFNGSGLRVHKKELFLIVIARKRRRWSSRNQESQGRPSGPQPLLRERRHPE